MITLGWTKREREATKVIVGFTYDASVHCPRCASARFGSEIMDHMDGFVDREGNEPGVIFDTSEWFEPSIREPQTLSCDDCGEVLDEYVPTRRRRI